MHMACGHTPLTLSRGLDDRPAAMATKHKTTLTDSIPVHDDDGAWHLVDEYTAYDAAGSAVARVYRRDAVEVKRLSASEFEDPSTGDVLRRIAPASR
jgi:hypothetical protein